MITSASPLAHSILPLEVGSIKMRGDPAVTFDDITNFDGLHLGHGFQSSHCFTLESYVFVCVAKAVSWGLQKNHGGILSGFEELPGLRVEFFLLGFCINIC